MQNLTSLFIGAAEKVSGVGIDVGAVVPALVTLGAVPQNCRAKNHRAKTLVDTSFDHDFRLCGPDHSIPAKPLA